MDTSDITEAMNKATAQGASMQIIGVMIQSYANYAGIALQGIVSQAVMREESLPDVEVARAAWQLADAMMVEYSKRGLGKVP